MRYTGRNPWDVLGVAEDAPFNDVKRAYYRRARTAHPDAPGGTAEAFREIHAAFEELRRRSQASARPARRPTPYDRWMSRTPGPARQWVDDDPLVADLRTPAPARRPVFADVLAAEVRRRMSSAA